MEWLNRLLSNRIIQLLILVLIVCGVCVLTGLNIHFSIGAHGFDGGITRGVNS